MYQKVTIREDILRRPDYYVGSIEKHRDRLWKYDDKCDRMRFGKVSYVPALYNMFDEILVEVADHNQVDPEMDLVEVEINQAENLISVFNSGHRIPVIMREEKGESVPEFISPSYLYPKIFSKEFTMETAVGKHQYMQVFRENMSLKDKPVTQTCEDTQYWAKIAFQPDLEIFNMNCLEHDLVALMKKRVVDLAGCLSMCRGKKVKVVLNGKEIPVKSFYDYAYLYLGKNITNPLPSNEEDMSPRWQILVGWSGGKKFKQVSFVNNINTIKGGTHVDYIAVRIAKCVIDAVKMKNKNANLKLHIVKKHLWVFVNALIDYPIFDSCMKETLITPAKRFRSTCELSDEFLKRVVDTSGVVESLLLWVELKMSKELVCHEGRVRDPVSLLYGLRDTQRKVLFAAFKKKLVNRIDVARLSDEISRDIGEERASIKRTLIGMAQNFVGANNINLFMAQCQFGTRYLGGKEAASPRFLYTNLTEITRFLFPREDDILPDGNGRYVPIIPMVLVNGPEQQGTGWRKFCPSYNPRHIIANLKRLLNSEPLDPMTPWYRNFRGTIKQMGSEDTRDGANYTTFGIIDVVNEDVDLIDDNKDVTLRVTELPIKLWTHDYKKFLHFLAKPNDKSKEAFIKRFCDLSYGDTVCFELVLSKKNYNIAQQGGGLLEKFELTTTLSTSIVLADEPGGSIREYHTTDDIIQSFARMMLRYYANRKEESLKIYQSRLERHENEIIRCLLGRENVLGDEEPGCGYEDLSTFEIREKLLVLHKNLEEVQDQIKRLERETARSLWLKDLAALDKALEEKEKRDEGEEDTVVKRKRFAEKSQEMEIGEVEDISDDDDGFNIEASDSTEMSSMKKVRRIELHEPALERMDQG